MTIQDGFIVDVSSYCDRWCARCPLTTRCELFATYNGNRREMTFDSRAAMLEENMTMQAMHEQQHGARPEHGDSKLPRDLELSPCGPDPEVARNSAALHRKAKRARFSANAAVRLASETIAHFTLFVPVKMLMCLGTVSRNGAGPQQSEANGWGKAALLGLDRMKAAWQVMVDTHHYTAKDVAPFLSEIARMERNLQRAVPNARAFVRPGFDEMEEVSLLDSNLRRN